MTSEIRANVIKNRVGLGTIEYSNTGPIISGVTTALNFKTGTSNLHNTGLNVQDLDVDGHTNLDHVNVSGTSTITGVLYPNNGFRVPNQVYSYFGSGNDLSIRHDESGGHHSYIFHHGAGVFKLASDTQMVLGETTNRNYIVMNPNSDVKLYFNNGEKLATAGHGINITGGFVATGDCSIADKITHAGDENTSIRFPAADTFTVETAGSERLRISSTGNVGIGTNNPQCILDINKDIAGGVNYVDIRNHHATGGAALRVKSQGSYGSPFYQGILGASDLGGTIRVGAVSNHPLVFIINNQEKVRITQNGKVGIGTDNPAFFTDIQADGVSGDVLRLTATSSGQMMNIQNKAGSSVPAILRFASHDGSGFWDLQYNNNDNSFSFDKNDGEKVRITSDGKLVAGGSGIGYPSRLQSHGAGNLLDLNSTSGAAVIRFYESGTGRFDIRTNNGSSGLNFYDSLYGVERLRITSTGQLLLGELSAFDSNVAMQFRKDNAGSQSRFIFRNRGNNGSSRVRLVMSTLNRAANADIFSGMEQYQSGGMAIFNGQSDTSHCGIDMFAGNWRPLRLKNGSVSGNDVCHMQAYWGTSNGLQMEVGGPQSGTHKAIRFQTSHYGGERGYIGVTLGGTSYNSSSDYRMKQDVIDLTGAIDRVKSFKPKRFKWKEDPTYTVDGFLAHEASTVVPESVVGEKDAVDSNGDPEYQVMDNSKLVPVLTAALKEAIAKIEILETKVAALEG